METIIGVYNYFIWYDIVCEYMYSIKALQKVWKIVGWSM